MNDRISWAVCWTALGLTLGSLATLQAPTIAIAITGAVIVVICLAEHFGWLRRRSSGKRPLPRSAATSGRSSAKKKLKKVKV